MIEPCYLLKLKTADSTPKELIWAHPQALGKSRRVYGAPSPMDVVRDQRRRVEEILRQLGWVERSRH